MRASRISVESGAPLLGTIGGVIKRKTHPYGDRGVIITPAP
jgi:hypothetical protein